MSNKHLHIVSFDVPYPADYGGVIDVFYRIKALSNLGVKIILHCFEYGRGQQKELEQYAAEVYYYKRRKSIMDSVGKLPFIVKTRNSKELLGNLLKDDHPILFEGLHTTYFMNDPALSGRVKIVRMHNIEHEYYEELSKQHSGLKRKFFTQEAKKLEQYEHILSEADHVLAIKESDAAQFKKLNQNTHILPASCPTFTFRDQQQTQPYSLYHGNLSVAENSAGAKWLIDNIFKPLGLLNKFKIAGKNPTDELIDQCKKEGIELLSNPSNEALNQLISEARLHVFYTEQATGVKLKLVHALNSSGHVIVNPNMVEGTELGTFCSIATNGEEFKAFTTTLLQLELKAEEFDKRQQYLKNSFDTEKNCALILALI